MGYVNFIGMNSLQHFICCETDSMLRSNAMGNAMVVDKAFCEYVDWIVVLAEALWAGKQSISRICVYSSEDESLPPTWWKRSDVVNLPPGRWLLPMELVPYCSLNIGLGSWQIGQLAVVPVSLGKRDPLMLSPHIASIPATVAAFYLWTHWASGIVAGECALRL